MFSKSLTDYAEQTYQNRLPLFAGRRAQIEAAMESCSPDEQLLMKFLYGTMPLSDVGEYDFSVFYAYVSHALFLAETTEWLRDVPEELFLHYVLYHRVNSEAIEDCRSFFYGQLHPRLQGLTAKEAALEVNYWCAENGCYCSSDDRTISPMTMYLSGKGRCGEESVFAVTAFRSVGIPARQIYTPRWGHCDDNHAWVEVYVHGAWHFLGACEPEEVLDKGWFSRASSRALLVHSLTFSGYGIHDEVIGCEGQAVYHNHTSFYAKTRTLDILVQDEHKNPVPHALVSVEILNMAEYSSAASLRTDEQGRARITLGLGDVRLHAEKDGLWTEQILFAEHSGAAVLCLPALLPQIPHGDDHSPETAYTLKAPKACALHPVSLADRQKQKNRRRLDKARALRDERIHGYFQEALAQNYPREAEIFRSAGGNFQEIYRFLSRDGAPDRRALLHSLSAKDYQDARADILESHLQKALVFKNLWEGEERQEIYLRYLLCPRIYLERLTDYRSFIEGFFTDAQKKAFLSCPQAIWQYIQTHVQNHSTMDEEALCSTPKGCLELSHGSLLGQKILFVAICRTLGIPARINPVTEDAEWYGPCSFISLAKGKKAESPAILYLSSDSDMPLSYSQHWTIGRLTGSRFVTLRYAEKTITREKAELLLAPGTYRLLTTCRLPNGNQHVKEWMFCLHSGQRKEILLHHKPLEIKDLLTSHPLEDFYVNPGQEEAAPCLLSSLIRREFAVLAFLQEGEEPTEHVLNELLAQENHLLELDVQMLLILRSREAKNQKTLQKVLSRFPQIQVVWGDFDELAEPVARSLYLEPENYPLLAVVRRNLEAVYGNSGYHVGVIGLMEQVLRFCFSKNL